MMLPITDHHGVDHDSETPLVAGRDLIAKVYQVDPLVCTRCGQKMKPIAFLTDQLSITRILDHLGLSAPPQDKPPPAREILRLAEHGEGWGVPAHWE